MIFSQVVIFSQVTIVEPWRKLGGAEGKKLQNIKKLVQD